MRANFVELRQEVSALSAKSGVIENKSRRSSRLPIVGSEERFDHARAHPRRFLADVAELTNKLPLDVLQDEHQLHGLKAELKARGVSVSHNAVWVFLRREGLRFKKNAIRP